MGFLRSEAGEMVMPGRAPGQPAAVPASVVPPAVVPPKELREPARPPRRRAATQHCRFFCQWCGSVLLLAHDRIGLPFAPPFLRRLESRSLASVCSSCSHVGNFSLFRGSPGFDTRHGLVPADPHVEPVLIDWLRCDEPSCGHPLPLFLLPGEPLSRDVVRELALTWHWNELACPAGHRILAPLWIFGRAPYRIPDPIR